MANDYYTPDGTPGTGAFGASAPIRTEFGLIAAGFDKLPSLAGLAAGTAIIVNPGGTALINTVGRLALAGDFITTGAHNTTLIQQADVSLTLPAVSGTLATLAGAESFTNKTFSTGSIAAAVTGATQTPETNNTTLATTAYADLAVRAIVIRRQTFAASDTYTPHAKLIYCDIECWGGGGGGGGTTNSGAGVWAAAAGGGAGSYSRRVSSKATIGASQVVIIGAAGSGGTPGTNAGGNGGDTSVGALCIGKGGSGGAGGTGSVSPVAGGLGGVAGTGDITGTGMPGGQGFAVTGGGANGPQLGSIGGSAAMLGGGALAADPSVSGAGNNATGRASGGGGGISLNAGGAAAGGAATAGYVVITEYCYG